MILVPAKEQPNTPNINTWPEGTSPNGNTLSSTKKRINGKKFSLLEQETETERRYDENRSYMLQRVEFYIVVILFSCIWYFLLSWLLRWMKFPVHKYNFEVYCMFLIPCFLIVSLTYILDMSFDTRSKEE